MQEALREPSAPTGGPDIAPARPVPADVFERMVAVRRDLHRHPELGWETERTAQRIEAELDRLGIAHRRLRGTGVVADLPGPDGVPAVGLRADTDALPIPEETGLPFASEIAGRMHACGHDGHTAILLGAAELLVRDGDRPAPVRLVFQPGEEVGDGALGMIEAGVLDGVGMIFAGHLDRHFPAGALVVTEGVVGASTDAFTIRISGREGHAARPHEAIDAVVVGSLIVMALQTIVSREIDPDHPSVVTVGRFRAGHVQNAIAGQALLEGTIRAQEADVRDHLHRAVRRVAESAAALHGATLDFSIDAGTPVLVNGPEATAIARRAAVDAVGEERVVELDHANMGGEDFSYYLRHVPGCYIRYGAQVAGRESCPNHSSKFEFDEEGLATGAAWLARVAHVAGERLKEG